MNCRQWPYSQWCDLLKNVDLPALFVDLDQFRINLEIMKKVAEEKKKRLRLASKSLRCPALIDLALKEGAPIYQGIMCFSLKEAYYLFTLGHKDLMLAYPLGQIPDLALLAKIIEEGGSCPICIDHIEQLNPILNHWEKISSHRLPIFLDVDASLKIFGLHLGVYRSSLTTIKKFEECLLMILKNPQVEILGIMHYDAQIAGLPDRDREFFFIQKIKEWIRLLSISSVKKERLAMKNLCEKQGLGLQFFNGGGSMSLIHTEDSVLDEVTVGSGLLHSHLFDKYSKKITESAMFFALPITRFPDFTHVVCHSGGFIASGEVSQNKSPEIHLPNGLSPISGENFGEVQTPLRNNSLHHFTLGMPVICRPSKAGETMERFNQVHFISGGKIVSTVPSYRGLGFNFF